MEDFPARLDDDELLREELDVLELAPTLDPRLRVATDALLRAGEPEVELWLHEPGLAALCARLTPGEARELASMLERQAAEVEHAAPSLARCPGCDGRGVVAPSDELYCERCDGAGTIPAAGRAASKTL